MESRHRISRRTFALGVAAAAAAPAAVRAAAPAVGSFSLGWVKSTANLLAPYAVENGATYGLTIASQNFNTAQDVLTAMIAGQIDVGLLTPIHLIRSIDTGLDFVQIAGNARGGTGVIAAKSLNLAKDDWAGFKKLAAQRKVRVASSRGSVNEALAIAEFQKNGVDLQKDVELSNIANFAEQPQALRSGQFDMIVTLEPLSALSVMQGIGTLFSYPYSTAAGNLNTNYVVSRKWLGENGAKAQAFVEALRDGQKRLSSDDAFKLASGTKLTGLAPNVLQMAFRNTAFDITNGVAQMQALAKIAVAEKYTAKDVSAELPRHVDDRFLRRAKVV